MFSLYRFIPSDFFYFEYELHIKLKIKKIKAISIPKKKSNLLILQEQ